MATETLGDRNEQPVTSEGRKWVDLDPSNESGKGLLELAKNTQTLFTQYLAALELTREQEGILHPKFEIGGVQIKTRGIDSRKVLEKLPNIIAEELAKETPDIERVNGLKHLLESTQEDVEANGHSIRLFISQEKPDGSSLTFSTKKYITGRHKDIQFVQIKFTPATRGQDVTIDFMRIDNTSQWRAFVSEKDNIDPRNINPAVIRQINQEFPDLYKRMLNLLQ